jgi:predicted TIM-barrel enzyme
MANTRALEDILSGRHRSAGPVIAVVSGSGQVARCAVQGGADLLIVLSAGFFRHIGAGSLASLMPYSNANEVTTRLLREQVLPCRGSTPVIAGVLATDPAHPVEEMLENYRALGVDGVTNWPAAGFFGGSVRQLLKAEEAGVEAEVELLRKAREQGLAAFGFALEAEAAERFAETGAEALILGMGLTRRLEDVREHRDKLQQAIVQLQEMLAAIANGYFAGTQNLFAGLNAGQANASGSFNTFIGPLAGRYNLYGDENTFVGSWAGWYSTNAFHCTAVGNESAQNLGNSTYATYLGCDSGPQFATVACYSNTMNTGLGCMPLEFISNGCWNTALGASSQNYESSGYWNTSEGFSSMYSNIKASNNTANGAYALYAMTNGWGNTTEGASALQNGPCPNNTLALGAYAGSGSSNNQNNIFIGYQCQTNTNSVTNSIVIGADPINAVSNWQIVIGTELHTNYQTNTTSTNLSGFTSQGYPWQSNFTTTPFPCAWVAYITNYVVPINGSVAFWSCSGASGWFAQTTNNQIDVKYKVHGGCPTNITLGYVFTEGWAQFVISNGATVGISGSGSSVYSFGGGAGYSSFTEGTQSASAYIAASTNTLNVTAEVEVIYH